MWIIASLHPRPSVREKPDPASGDPVVPKGRMAVGESVLNGTL